MKSPWSQDLYVKAYKFAAHAHRGQTLPGKELPYIVHLSFVSMEVIAALSMEPGFVGDLAVSCSLLHDTIEDTDVTYDNIWQEFGENVANGVLALTKDPNVATNSPVKDERKRIVMADSLQRIQTQPKEIWMVKMADRIANLQPPPHYWDENKTIRYKEEASEIYEALKEASNFLAARLKTKIEVYR